MVNHHHHNQCASISNQKKKGFHLRDFTKIYRSLFALRSWRHPQKSDPSPEPHHFPSPTVEDPKFQGTEKENHHSGQEKEEENHQDQGNMYGVGSYRYKDDGLLRRGFPRSTSANSFKHRSMDIFFSTVPSNFSRTGSKRCPSPGPSFARRSASLRRSEYENGFPESLSRNSSRKNGTNPIMFSNSTGPVKPPIIERQLECTLEELCYGCMKKVKITRDVLTKPGQIVQEEEILSIKVKPGWKKGTKITFEGMGNEGPVSYPADVTFVIAEKKHNLFRRDGDDLELAIQIPLVQALTGCSIPIPLLGEERMDLEIDEIIHPGYEKIIEGKGMPKSKEQGSRGNLKVVFLINFPIELTDEQRAEAVNILGDSCC